MSIRYRWLVGLCGSLGLAVAASAQPDAARVLHGAALVGVDSLGRVLLAVDQAPEDGYADHFFLFTAAERLAGPWETYLSEANIVQKERSLTLHSRATGFELSLGRADMRPQPSARDRDFPGLVRHDGQELVTVSDDSQTVRLAELRLDEPQGWPLAFRYDLLDPASLTCLDPGNCQAGGKGSTSCSISGCAGMPSSCNVSCSSPHFSCCLCQFPQHFASCRCIPCAQ